MEKTYVRKETTNVNLYVDNVNGIDSSSCGTSTGAGACSTITQATRNLCVNYDHTAVPTIHGTAGQTYPNGIQFKGGFSQTASLPSCNGISQIVFDGHGSTIDSNDGGAVILRYIPMSLEIKNVTLKTSSVNGSVILVRGPGLVVIDEGVTIGKAGTGWPQVWAYGSGANISTCPTGTCPLNTSIGITIGGEFGFLASEGGSIQIEGTTLTLSGTPVYNTAFAGAKNGGSLTFFGTSITGAATGKQFYSGFNSIVNISAQTGAYSNCPALSYLPGSQCGVMVNSGSISETGTPVPTSGCGTGCIIQNGERGFIVIYGTGLGSTNGTVYGPARITFATQTNYQACSLTTNDPAIGTPWALVAPPAGGNNGYVDIYWKGNGSSPSGKTISLICKTN